MKVTEISPDRYKTLRGKEKSLGTSTFFYSHSVFKKLVLQKRKNQGFFWESFNSLPNGTILDLSKLKAFADKKINVTEKFKSILGRVKNIIMSNFSFSHSVFKRLVQQTHKNQERVLGKSLFNKSTAFNFKYMASGHIEVYK